MVHMYEKAAGYWLLLTVPWEEGLCVEVYLARQPIFDQKMNIAGYELLYRRSMNNYFEGTDDNQATADLISNAFLVMPFHELTGGTKAFINFSGDMLIREIPLVLPRKSIVVEVLERVEATEAVFRALSKLKGEGYTIALDDFAFGEANLPFLELADIVKVEFPAVDIATQRHFISLYAKRIKFLAEKVETREDYQLASQMGYSYFQGYFFSRPVIEKRREIVSIPATLMRLMSELNRPDPDYQTLTEIIETDVGLSYKLLRLAGSVFFGTKGDVFTVKHALVRMGFGEIRKWVYLLLLKDVQNVDNRELITNCLIRAKFMELLAITAGGGRKHYAYFLAGLFSSVDILLDCSMEAAVKELPIAPEVKEALLKQDNDIRRALDLILNYEQGNWDNVDTLRLTPAMGRENLMPLYVESLQWMIRQHF